MMKSILMAAIISAMAFGSHAFAEQATDPFEDCVVVPPKSYVEHPKCYGHSFYDFRGNAAKFCRTLNDSIATDSSNSLKYEVRVLMRCVDHQNKSLDIVLEFMQWPNRERANYLNAKRIRHAAYVIYDNCIVQARPATADYCDHIRISYCLYKELTAAILLGHFDSLHKYKFISTEGGMVKIVKKAQAIVKENADGIGVSWWQFDFNIVENLNHVPPFLLPDSKFPD